MRALILGIMISVTGLAGDFCHVDNWGNERCNYISMSSCEMAVDARGGMCIYKSSNNNRGGFNTGGFSGFSEPDTTITCTTDAWGNRTCN